MAVRTEFKCEISKVSNRCRPFPHSLYTIHTGHLVELNDLFVSLRQKRKGKEMRRRCISIPDVLHSPSIKNDATFSI